MAARVNSGRAQDMLRHVTFLSQTVPFRREGRSNVGLDPGISAGETVHFFWFGDPQLSSFFLSMSHGTS